jgi:hypothetical protein
VNEFSTSVFHSASNGDTKKIHKIDKIKHKLVEMLRESFHHIKQVLSQSTTMCTGEIGFKLSNGRLPWSTLDRDLQRTGYMIVDWPQGVVRDRDKGISGLGGEDADKLHDALFVNKRRIRFVPCGKGTFLSTQGAMAGGLLTPPLGPAYNNERLTSLAVASGSDGSRESDRSTAGKQARFRVTTAEAYTHKKRCV